MAGRSKNRLFSKFIRQINNDLTIKSEGIAEDAIGGTTVYATRSSLPSSSNTAGDQAYVTENNRLYIWNGSGWYNIALLNIAPAISSVQDSDGNTTPFVLSSEGAVTTITITAADSDGDPITYSAIADSDFSGIGTITNDGNEFTITPFSQDSASTASGTITFRATDGVNIASSGVQAFTLVFLSPFWDETVLSIGTNSTNGLNNSTFIDRSTNAHTVTPAGSPVQTAFHPYLENWSLYNSGDNNGLYKDFGAKPAPLSFVTDTTSDGTIEAWIYLDQTPDTTLGSGHTGSTIVAIGDTYLAFIVTSTLKLRIYWWTGSTNAIDSTGSVSLHTWHHVAMVKDGNAIAFYIDGVAAGTGTITATSWASSANGNYLRIANNFGSGDTAAFKGYLSNLRLTDAIVYSGAFTPSTEALTAITDTTLLTCQSNRFIDNSTDAHALTLNGSPEVSAFNPFGQESEYTPAENKGSVKVSSSGWLTSASNANFAFGTGDFTVEFWLYSTSSSGYQYINHINDFANGFWIYQDNNVTNLVIGVGGADSLEEQTGGALNAWNHYAVVRSSGTLTIYLNGVANGSIANSGNVNQGAWYLGIYNAENTAYSTQGFISDYRLVNDTALYTSNFTPPTAPVSNTNADLYIPMDNAGIFDKTGNHILTLVGDTSTSTTQTKFADTAMYFDGTGDYIDTTPLPAFGTEDFTIEFWFRASTINSAYKALIDTRGNANDPGVWIHETNKLYYFASANQRIIGTTTLVEDTWYHAAACRSNGVTKLFLNGIQESSNYSDTASYTSSAVRIGQRYTDTPFNFHGYIENLQILNGAAKYTANFTPPTRTQGREYQAES